MSAARRAPRWVLFCILLTWLVLGCQVLFGGVTIDPVNTEDAECTPGESRCNGEYLLSCESVDTGWTLKATCGSGDLCDAKDKHCAVCKDGDFRCSGAQRQQCDSDGKGWHTVETCSAQNLCSESSCNGCVTNGQLDCSLGTQLRQCKAGVWVTLDQCASHTLCAATTAYATTVSDWDQKCLPASCPEAGKYQCAGAILQRCPPERDAWVNVDTCNNEALCQGAVQRLNGAVDPNVTATFDMCAPACPVPNGFMCDGANLRQCRADQTAWDAVKTCPADTECDPVAGDCGKLCKPGQYQCNGAVLRKCADNGHWADEAECQTAALCSVSSDNNTGACLPSPCGKNDFVCNGAVLQKCKADRTGYEDNMTCASAALCDAPSARCVAPTCTTAGAFQCFGQELKQCAPDLTKWNSVTTCPTGQYCDSGPNAGCMTACPANPLRCNGKVLEHCSAATGWTTQATCSTNDLCSCALTDPDGAGPLTNSCLNGLYKDGCGNVVCGAPLANYQCNGAELRKCQAGRNGWDKVSTCDAANLCYAGEAPSYSNGYCLACPVAGELSCGGSTLRVCSNDRRSWNTSQTCGLGCMAVSNGQDYCAACKAGTVQCAGQTLQSCPADQKGFQNQTCANVCDAANGQCDQCAANSYWCDGATLNQCSSDGQSKTATVCQSSSLCNAGAKKCDACMAGQHQCKGNNAQVCNADKSGFVNDVDCGAPGCNSSSNECNACAAGQHKCKGNNLQICNADKSGFVNDVDCGSVGCNATTNACNPPMICTPMAYQCTGTASSSLQQCNASGTAWMAVQTCSTICDAAHGECDECKAPAYQCAPNVLQDCSSSGHWETLMDCKMATCNPAGSCDTVGGGGSGGGSGAGGAPSGGAPAGGAPAGGAPAGGAPAGGAPAGGAGNAGAPSAGAANAGAADAGDGSGGASVPGP